MFIAIRMKVWRFATDLQRVHQELVVNRVQTRGHMCASIAWELIQISLALPKVAVEARARAKANEMRKLQVVTARLMSSHLINLQLKRANLFKEVKMFRIRLLSQMTGGAVR